MTLRLVSSRHPSQIGPSRGVLTEATFFAAGQRLYRYELHCGHTVVRSAPRKQRCYCEQCAEPKPLAKGAPR